MSAATAALVPEPAEIVGKQSFALDVHAYALRVVDPAARPRFAFVPGQFNMVYVPGVGEVAISISSDPEDDLLEHTIRIVGRTTRAIAALGVGDVLGLRGPFGRGWPLLEAVGKDVVIVTGGLGCAPVVSVINYLVRRRERFGRLIIMQGVKHSNDLIWRDQYEHWAQLPDTQVLLAADVGGPVWSWHVGPVTVLFDKVEVNPERTLVMMCGPEAMMRAAARNLLDRGVPENALWLSLERNMQCGVGHCGPTRNRPW